ncbi:MAG: tRNA lysidine(34) synthetase TilS [Planctomycetes bacterium]|nr:tRNA lysidine(34) synthetase TilS [Planctomycetota bacterium]
MLLEFEQKVADFIKANKLFGSVDKVLLAVSGGADSTALLYAMRALSSENVFRAELLCAHINHQLREAEADLDEDFVIAQSARLKLAITTRRVDVRGYAGRNKLSIETAARELRIKNLLEIARANNCKTIATAHQKNDNAETILQRLTRGTGFRGLGGIWPMRVFGCEFKFVRPLLCVRRDEIIEYLEQRNLKWRQTIQMLIVHTGETIFGIGCFRRYNKIAPAYSWSNYPSCLNQPAGSIIWFAAVQIRYGQKLLIPMA